MSDKLPVAFDKKGLQLKSMEDAYRFAKAVIASKLAPRGLDTPEKILIAVQAGAELGFAPMRSLNSIHVINGKPGLSGDAARALVLSSGLTTGFEEKIEGEGENMVAVCRSSRHSGPVVETRFSVKDAKQAKLWGKAGPWTDYPKRMLKYRALGFHVRDVYPDALMGLHTTEELEDLPPEAVHATVAETSEPPPGDDPLLLEAEEPEAEPDPEKSIEDKAREVAEKALFKLEQRGET